MKQTSVRLTMILFMPFAITVLTVACVAQPTPAPPTATTIPATVTAVPPTATSIPPTVTPVPQTATTIPLPTTTSLPDFVLPGARTRYSFEQIIPLLSSPQLVSQFMKNNVKNDVGWDAKNCGGVCYTPAWLVYQNGVDDLHGHSTLQCYILERNGWDAYLIGLSIESPVVGWNVCGVNINQTVLVLDVEGEMVGPFKSLAEVARFYISHGMMKEGGMIRTLKASTITQITSLKTTPTILGLPWTFQTY